MGPPGGEPPGSEEKGNGSTLELKASALGGLHAGDPDERPRGAALMSEGTGGEQKPPAGWATCGRLQGCYRYPAETQPPEGSVPNPRAFLPLAWWATGDHPGAYGRQAGRLRNAAHVPVAPRKRYLRLMLLKLVKMTHGFHGWQTGGRKGVGYGPDWPGKTETLEWKAEGR